MGRGRDGAEGSVPTGEGVTEQREAYPREQREARPIEGEAAEQKEVYPGEEGVMAKREA